MLSKGDQSFGTASINSDVRHCTETFEPSIDSVEAQFVFRYLLDHECFITSALLRTHVLGPADELGASASTPPPHSRGETTLLCAIVNLHSQTRYSIFRLVLSGVVL